VILVIDEFTNLVWRDALPADIYRILPSMAIEYAGVGVHGVIISHDYSRAGLGNELGASAPASVHPSDGASVWIPAMWSSCSPRGTCRPGARDH
jgi:hypothetical protein